MRIRRSGDRPGVGVTRFINLVFFVAILLITIGVYLFLQGAKAHKVLILSVSGSDMDRKEINNAAALLSHTYGFKADKGRIKDILSTPSLLEKYDALWIHKTDTTVLSEQFTNGELPRLLGKYLEKGGNILLTDEAFPLVYYMGLEREKPAVRSFTVKSNGFIRVEGFHSFRGHPVFKGLFGGAYVYQPMQDTVIRAWGYFDNHRPENGKVVAIRWQDIFFRDKDKVILEYHRGKGKLIAVGSSVYLSQANDLRDHMRKFITNIFEYFVNPPDVRQTITYWNDTSSAIVRDTLTYEAVLPGKVKKWLLPEPVLRQIDKNATTDPWDLAGSRMLIMGHEKGGLEEVWIHPFMALRDYEAGMLFVGDTAIHWLKKESPVVEVRAAAFLRHYHFKQGRLDEIIVPHPYRAAGVIHYDYKGNAPAELVFRFRSNLRWMWPYAQSATGGMKYAWSDSLQSFIVKDGHDEAMVLVGMNKKPVETKIGPYEEMKITTEGIHPVTGKKYRVAAAARIRLPASGHVDVILAGSWGSSSRAIDLYRKVMADPQQVPRDQYAYVHDFLRQATRIKSPDTAWNEAYRWSLLNARRFMVRTPGVGTSLVAGYATTARGWDGAQPVSGRPGYAWYFGRDGEWSAMAMLDYGDFEQVRKVLELYMHYQDISGKIFHELTTSGVVHYSAADATPLFVVLAGRYLRYSGDITFIGEHREAIRKAMNFCYSTDFNHDGLIENRRVGHGWVEGGPLYGSRTTLYLASVWAEALREAAWIFQSLGEEDTAAAYEKDSQKVTGIIDHNFWNDSIRFFSHGLNPDGTFSPVPTIMPAIPMLFGQIRQPAKITPVMEQFAGDAFSTDWGTRILPGNSPLFNPQSYHGGSVWPLYTGWVALAEYRNGFAVQGFMHMAENMSIGDFWAKGAIEEVMNGMKYFPMGVCWHQCWSEIMISMPALEGMLGWEPDALHHRAKIKPEFPAGWDTVTVTGLRVGNQRVGMKMEKNDSVTVFAFSHKGSGSLAIELYYPFPGGTSIQKITMGEKNGHYKVIAERYAVKISFDLNKKTSIVIHHRGGIALIPPVPEPLPGDQSHGFRFIDEHFSDSVWMVKFQGRPGITDTFCIRAYQPVLQVKGASLIRKTGNHQTYQIRFPESKGKYRGKKVFFRLK